jgi:hypothetical protein
MMPLKLPNIVIETVSYDDATIGRLSSKDFHCFTLELPWLDNKTNISCVPPDTYKYKKRFSPSKKMVVIELIGVKGRTFIQLHIGNFTSQILGCCLVGMGITYLNSDTIPDLADSETALNKLLESCPDTGTIEIIRYGKDFEKGKYYV